MKNELFITYEAGFFGDDYIRFARERADGLEWVCLKVKRSDKFQPFFCLKVPKREMNKIQGLIDFLLERKTHVREVDE